MNELWSKCDTYISEIKAYQNKLAKTNRLHIPTRQLYSFVKQITPEFFIDGQMHSAYDFIREHLILYETKLPYCFISSTLPDFNIHIDKPLSLLHAQETLDYIVYQVRKQLILDQVQTKIFPRILNVLVSKMIVFLQANMYKVYVSH